MAVTKRIRPEIHNINAAGEGNTFPSAAFSSAEKKKAYPEEWLSVSAEDMAARGWEYYDFLLITADAYVDHPSFGTAIIGRVLESEGYRVAVCAQPEFTNEKEITSYGEPRLAVLINGGNMDPMVAHYTAAKKKRNYDYYSPGGVTGKRPDRATVTYAKLSRKAFPAVPVLIGGIEASLRRFAHYDYWEDRVMPSILAESGADILMFGMGELSVKELAWRLNRGDKVKSISNISGTCYKSDIKPDNSIECSPYPKICNDKTEYAKSCRIQYREHDHISSSAISQKHILRGREFYVTANPPQRPLTTAELDAVYDLPYMRYYHPCYEAAGGIPAIEEVEFSITHNRGCIGGCSFCSIAFHQGRYIQSRSIDSVIGEAKKIIKSPRFKGYINDVGGPTANLRKPSCNKQLKEGICKNRVCLSPEPCPALEADHSEYIDLLKKLRELEGIKKVFVRSGIRYDYMLADKKYGDKFLMELTEHHISGQLKVAPEHCSDNVLRYMNKSGFDRYEEFEKKFELANRKLNKKQYLVPYLMSSHPGSRIEDAVMLARYLNKKGRHPEQVQDFYPTPGTMSTCMYYTGIDPRTMKPVYTVKDAEGKAMQRALLQWNKLENKALVRKALLSCGMKELIGNGKECLIRDDNIRKSEGRKKR